MLAVIWQPSQAAHFTVNEAQEEFYWTGRQDVIWSSGALELWQLGTVNVGRQEDERLRQSVNTNVRLEQDDPPNSHHNMRSHHGRAGKPPQYNNFGF